jgi:glucose-6-phosphate isomerase
MRRQQELQLDLTGFMDAGIGASGLGEADLDRIAPRASAAVATTLARRASGEIGFLDLPDDRATARAAMDWARALPPEIDTVVVLGIGGSSLGPRALYSALAPAWDPLRSRSPGMPRRLLFPDNVDPQTVRAVLDLCPPERTLFNVVTKSGGTAETAAQLMIVHDHLERRLGAENARRHLVATTDPAKGALRRLATTLGWTTFAVPPSVGGRFSVLSAVGLVPAAAAGLDVIGLLDGAARMRDRVLATDDLRQNPALLLAALLHLHHVERGRPLTVMMSYVDALYDTADWFRQLWAESLGKEKATDGRIINTGPTPIAARGATDQHSQLQLYAEGPDDKAFLMLSVRDRGVEVKMPTAGTIAGDPDYAYLAGRGVGELLDAELRGTIGSLRGRRRPVAEVQLDRPSAGGLGELIMLLEAATAFAGPLYDVDPYDQPGVEEAKRLAYAALGRPGYEALAAQMAAAPGSDPRYVM